MSMSSGIQPGDKVVVGKIILTVTEEFAASLKPGDEVLGVASTGVLRRISKATSELVADCVSRACIAFDELSRSTTDQVNIFYESCAQLMADPEVFAAIQKVNGEDVVQAQTKGRSTTRLVLDEKMRKDMVAAFAMWQSISVERSVREEVTQHVGWRVEQYRSPLGVVGFVFEGRPNVFADATGVLKGGNTVVFRIGSDALGTAREIMSRVIVPSLNKSGLPHDSVVLIDSTEHAAGWAMFSDVRLALAVARGSGEAVAELGSIAKQAGISVSLHGTGGAWMILGESADAERVSAVVEHSLDRKVCNTLNVVCIPKSRVDELGKVVTSAAHRAAESRGAKPVIHVVGQKIAALDHESVLFGESVTDLAHEFEWESDPEFHIVVVDAVDDAIALFNNFSPQFVVSAISNDPDEIERVWTGCNAPFVGNGFTRWVDGQFALLRPELGLSNWENGRLFARSGVLSGDSAFTVRLRVTQDDIHLKR